MTVTLGAGIERRGVDGTKVWICASRVIEACGK